MKGLKLIGNCSINEVRNAFFFYKNTFYENTFAKTKHRFCETFTQMYIL